MDGTREHGAAGAGEENTAATPVASNPTPPADQAAPSTSAPRTLWADEPMELDSTHGEGEALQLFADDSCGSSFDCSSVIARLDREIDSQSESTRDAEAIIVDSVIAASKFSFLQTSVLPASSLLPAMPPGGNGLADSTEAARKENSPRPQPAPRPINILPAGFAEEERREEAARRKAEADMRRAKKHNPRRQFTLDDFESTVARPTEVESPQPRLRSVVVVVSSSTDAVRNSESSMSSAGFKARDPELDPPQGSCFNCWASDHRWGDCEAFRSRFCPKCGRRGMTKRNCTRCPSARKRPRTELPQQQQQQQLQQQQQQRQASRARSPSSSRASSSGPSASKKQRCRERRREARAAAAPSTAAAYVNARVERANRERAEELGLDARGNPESVRARLEEEAERTRQQRELEASEPDTAPVQAIGESSVADSPPPAVQPTSTAEGILRESRLLLEGLGDIPVEAKVRFLDAVTARLLSLPTSQQSHPAQ